MTSCLLKFVGVVALGAAVLLGVGRALLWEPLIDPYPTTEVIRLKYDCDEIGDTSDGVSCARERAPDPVAKVSSMAYPIIGRTDADLPDSLQFFKDFGLLPLWREGAATNYSWVADDDGNPESAYYLRCRGDRGLPCVQIRRLPPGATKLQHILGYAFTLDDVDQFAALAGLPEAEVAEVPAARGGGRRVALRDPDGLRVEVRTGYGTIKALDMDLHYRPKPNTYNETHREVGKTRHQARRFGPPPISRIMHCAFHPRQILRSLKWYQDRFGFLVSDFIYAPTVSRKPPFGVFLRVDNGPDKPADHHTFFLLANPGPVEHNHCAFEVRDWDDVAEGQRWLKLRRDAGAAYHHAVGVGRHMLGGQIYDYWREPVTQLWEHACDSDRMTSTYKPGYNINSPTAFGAMGDVIVSDDFVDENRIPGRLAKLLKMVLGLGPDPDPDDDYAGAKGLRLFLGNFVRSVLDMSRSNWEVPEWREWYFGEAGHPLTPGSAL